jgi:hypothetical protein
MDKKVAEFNYYSDYYFYWYGENDEDYVSGYNNYDCSFIFTKGKTT